MKEIFTNVYGDGKKMYTKSFSRKQVYGERFVGNKREWDPRRSKLAAALFKGLEELPIRDGCVVLYLGASTGTTVSHVSDIVGREGFVYAVEFAERVLRSLVDLSKDRKNVAAIRADARKPEEYSWVEECDVVFCDVADPQETEIAIKNAKAFLKEGGYLFISVKSQSIDVTKKPKEIYENEKKKVEKEFEIVDLIDLEPYQDKHAMIIAKK